MPVRNSKKVGSNKLPTFLLAGLRFIAMDACGN